MTEAELRQKLVETAKSYIGCKESDGSHRKIIDIYNAHKPLAVGYEVKYTDAWCSTFVSAMSILCGLTDILPTECGCGRHIELFKNLGEWVEEDGYVPSPGDIIFYNWSDNGTGDCTSGASHVGIVTSCDGKTITVIEGNISNAVGYRSIAVNGRYIRGFGVPKYDKLAEEKISMTKEEFEKLMQEYLADLNDNDSGEWSDAARRWAIENGLVNGIGNGKDGKPNYAWEAPVSREQLVTILHRFAKVIGKA